MQAEKDFKRRISIIRTHLCTQTPFFGSLALFTNIELSTRVPTAATDGRRIFINLAFFNTLKPDEQESVFIHEMLHAALLHVPRGVGRDRERWNIAADIVVNGIMAREGYALLKDAVRDVSLEHFSVEEVYDLLTQAPFVSAGYKLDYCDLVSPDQKDALADSQALYMGQKQQKDLETYWRNAGEQASIVAETSMYGSLPAYMHREFGSVTTTQLNWRHYLWRYLVHTPTDFSGFDRRFIGRKLYLDELTGESVQVVVAVDTSGSISDQQTTSFLGEVIGILQSYPHLKCDLYYIDTEAHGPYRLTQHTAIPAPIGGGGTDFSPFFELVPKNYDVAGPLVGVYLTDGYGHSPEANPRFPLLWVVTPGGLDTTEFPFGEVVRLLS